MMDASTFLQVSGGVMGLVVSGVLAWSQFINARIQLANRRDIVESRKAQKLIDARITEQAITIEKLEVNTNNLMEQSLKNKGAASHAAGVIEGRGQSAAETSEASLAAAAVLREAAEAAAAVLREASQQAAKVLAAAALALSSAPAVATEAKGDPR